MPVVHFVTNWQVFFCYCVSLSGPKGKEVSEPPGASEQFWIIPVASVLHDDKEHTGAGAVTSPHPVSVYTSTVLIIIPLQASLWAEWYFLFCFIFPNTLYYGIQYFFGPSGAPYTNFVRKCVYAVLLIPFLGCHLIYLCPHSILQIRPTAFLRVEKTGL